MKEVLQRQLLIISLVVASGVLQTAVPVVYSAEIESSSSDADSGDSYFDVESDEQLNNNEPISIPIPDPFIQPSLSQSRSSRFPSIDERIKLYMSNWYIPPCPGYDDGFVQYRYQPSTIDPNWAAVWIQEPSDTASVVTNNQHNFTSHVLESSITPDTAFFMEKGTIYDCSKSNKESETNNTYKERIKFRLNMNMYCSDITKLLVPALKRVLYDEKHSQLDQKKNDEEKIQRKLSSATKGSFNKQQLSVPTQTVSYRRLDGTDTSSTSAVEVKKSSKRVPIIMQFGDLKYSHTFRYMNVPHFKKFRSAAVSIEALDKVTAAATTSSCSSDKREILESYHGNGDKNNEPVLQPIIWKLATSRHFGLLDAVLESDTAWSEKKDMAVFMGQLTGSRDGFQQNSTDVENCLRLRRCRLVYDSANSTLVYARLTNTRGRLPDFLDGVELVSPKVPVSSLLEYKAVIMLEGNDVASGLKWALLSQSVVMMPQPKHTSWAMEELLQPWVHYVPISESLLDVEEKVQWILDNEKYARRIAQRGSQWMQDLVYHPDSKHDDKIIQEEMIHRYLQFFQEKPRNTNL